MQISPIQLIEEHDTIGAVRFEDIDMQAWDEFDINKHEFASIDRESVMYRYKRISRILTVRRAESNAKMLFNTCIDDCKDKKKEKRLYALYKKAQRLYSNLFSSNTKRL